MGDADLREVERRAKETGAVDDVAAWLVARLRAGVLDADRLSLAAFLGHPGARRALGQEDQPLAHDVALAARGWPSPDRWVDGLLERRDDSALRVALHAAREARRVWRDAQVERGEVPEQALEAGFAALACPCPEHHQAAADLARAAQDVVQPLDPPETARRSAGWSLVWATRSASRPGGAGSRPGAWGAVSCAADALGIEAGHPYGSRPCAAEGFRLLLARLLPPLVAWALAPP